MVFFPMFAGDHVDGPVAHNQPLVFSIQAVSWRAEGLQSLRTADGLVEHAASRVAESQPDLWTVVQNKYKSGIHTSCATFRTTFFGKIVELSVPQSHSLK